MGTLPNKIVQLRSQPHDKFIGRANEIMIDWCNQCLVIHDGLTPGGCFRLCVLSSDAICALMQDAPELGPLEGVNIHEDICEVLSTAPELGPVQS